jgi:hypothetical protein
MSVEQTRTVVQPKRYAPSSGEFRERFGEWIAPAWAGAPDLGKSSDSPSVTAESAFVRPARRQTAQREAVRPLKCQAFARQAAGKRPDQASRTTGAGRGT